MASAYSDRELYDLVRAVAERASPDEPQFVSQRVFDRGRAAAGHPHAPSARAICARLRDHRGRPFPWPSLLALVFDPDRDIDRTHGQLRGQEDANELGPRHLFFALNLAARRRHARTLTPGEYEHTRRRLIAEDDRRHDGGSDLDHLLPTVGQIEALAAREVACLDRPRRRQPDNTNGAAAGNHEDAGAPAIQSGPPERRRNVSELGGWDRALAVAGLDPRPATGRSAPAQADAEKAGAPPAPARRRQRREREEMPILEAISHFVDANGRWPSYETILKFINMAAIVVESPRRAWDDAGSTAEMMKRAREYRASLGLDSPSGDGARKGRARAGEQVRIPEGGIAGAPTGRTGRDAYKKTKDEVLDALERFDRELQPPSVPRTRARYVMFASEHGLPSATIFTRHGGFTMLMGEMYERKRRARADAA